MDDQAHNCKKCTLPIQEGHAYELGGDRWHVDCFQCSKCGKLLGVNSSFLVLGTGALVCSDCSYSCKSCNKKIYDMAILTGDQAYCSNCFKCKSCKKPIEDLRYARTSKGLFCMPCHHKLMEKKKKYEAMRLQKQKTLDAATALNKSTLQKDNLEEEQLNQEEKKFIDEADPGVQLTPTSTQKIIVTTPQRVTKSPLIQSKSTFSNIDSRSNIPAPATPPPPPPEFNSNVSELAPAAPISIPIVDNNGQSNQDDDEQLLTIPLRSPMRAPLSPIQNLTSEFQTPKLEDDPSYSVASPNHHQLLQAQLSPTPNKQSSRSTVNLRIGVSSPGNRDAFLFDEPEPESFIDLDDDETDEASSKPTATEDIEKDTNLHADEEELRFDHHSYLKSPVRSPSKNPPTSNVPKTPEKSTTGTNPSPSAIKGLNIAGLMLNDSSSSTVLAEDKNSLENETDFKTRPSPFKFGGNNSSNESAGKVSPATSKVTSSLTAVAAAADLEKEHSPQNHVRKTSGGSGLGRSISFKKVFHRHKRSVSGTGVNSNHTSVHQNERDKIQSLRDATSPRIDQNDSFESPNGYENGHRRNLSDQSIAAYKTPPLPRNASFHTRSQSETIHESPDTSPKQVSQFEIQLRMLNSEVATLTGIKASLLKEIQSLHTQKRQLDIDIQDRQNSLKQLSAEITSKQQQSQSISISDDSLPKPPVNNTTSLSLPSTEEAPSQEIFSMSSSSSNTTKLPTDQHQLSTSSSENPQSQSQPSSTSSAQGPPLPHQTFGRKQLSTEEFAELSQTQMGSATQIQQPQTQIGHAAQTQPPQHPSSSERPKKGGFMRRIFGNNGQQGGQLQSSNPQQSGITASPSIQSISSPMNFRQGDETWLTNNNFSQAPSQLQNGGSIPQSVTATEDEKPSSNGLGLSALIKSRSSNFMTRGNSSNNQTNINEKLLFKLSLQDRSHFERRSVPFIFSVCLSEIEKRGLTSEGIYRVSGSSLSIDKIEKFFESLDVNNDREVGKVPSVLEGDINAVAGLLKRYLKKLPDPVIPYRNYDHYLEISKISNEDIKLSQLKMLLNDLPYANLNVLYQLAKHLTLVVRNEQFTKMTHSSLATVFAPTLVRDNSLNPQREILDNTAKTITTEFLFRNYIELFSELEFQSALLG